MAEFVCTRCGKCCMAMGKYVTIRGTIGPTYIVRHELGDEICYATVERRLRDDFIPAQRSGDKSNWCPFLLESPDSDEILCAIHHTRPRFCREFRCAHIRICDQEGGEIGKVKGRRSLSASDHALREYWDREIAPLAIDADDRWRHRVREMLEEEGYLVEVYE